MMDLLKKGFFLGLGLFEEGKEKIEEFVDDLISAGAVANEERAAFVDKYLARLKEQEQNIIEKINAEVQKAVAKLGLPTKADFDRLSQQVEELKKKLEQKQ
ncbi:MAG: phasin family protein [candidate division KSB1 bacterium]|nr:phasin family protein [candidate division KSB1 bacterium]MDZ7334556.1 phasin family protein [candidate division KSB1 bacterium]MDZ7375806.1 phasin family protein [candidate division KSB1 bacterium]MDZ7400831.1 phasin family protein [candidate division KSB1 bacterium]